MIARPVSIQPTTSVAPEGFEIVQHYGKRADEESESLTV
jgi:hypothetical protein